jgi:hypothetical protein
MMKNIYTILILVFTLYSYAQNKLGEATVDNEGNVIYETETTSNTEKHKTSEEVLEEFYFNQNNIKYLDKLISFRFYQKTPYVKFNETMEAKNKLCGKLITYKITETEYSEENNAVRYKLEVKYEKKNTVEQIVLF